MEGEAKYWRDKWSEAQAAIKVLRDLLFMKFDKLKIKKTKKKRRN